MFSKELENLIQATLEDGILEDYEKAALVKRATAEGVDLAELEIYINSLLQKRKKEKEEEENVKQEIIDQRKKAAFGRVCPNCGKQVPPMTLKCECGYEFNQSGNTSERAAQILCDKINELKNKQMMLSPNNPDYGKAMNGYASTICDLIRNTPVPSTKEDIIDFLALSFTNSKKKGGILGTLKGRLLLVGSLSLVFFVFWTSSLDSYYFSERALQAALLTLPFLILGTILSIKTGIEMLRENRIADAWDAKFSQILIKGRSLRGDEEFTRQLNYYENQRNADARDAKFSRILIKGRSLMGGEKITR